MSDFVDIEVTDTEHAVLVALQVNSRAEQYTLTRFEAKRLAAYLQNAASELEARERGQDRRPPRVEVHAGTPPLSDPQLTEFLDRVSALAPADQPEEAAPPGNVLSLDGDGEIRATPVLDEFPTPSPVLRVRDPLTGDWVPHGVADARAKLCEAHSWWRANGAPGVRFEPPVQYWRAAALTPEQREQYLS